MIITRLTGGLGNQLFQYAFGRALSEKTGKDLLFDDAHYNQRPTVRQYELDKFTAQVNRSIPPAARSTIDTRYLYTTNKLTKLIGKLGLLPNKFENIHFLKESQFQYDQRMVQLCEDEINYYDGHWQSPRYFNVIRPLLLKELQIKPSLSVLTLLLSKNIQTENSVSIHVRRGDYIFNKKANNFHGICSLDYYQQAIKLFLKEEKDPTFYVFSDDIPWTKNNLIIEGAPVHYIEHTTDQTNYEDLYLMSICKHHIIANSSFSWWGAWLNDNPLKRVIAPKKWFTNESIKTDDLIPAEWIRI